MAVGIWTQSALKSDGYWEKTFWNRKVGHTLQNGSKWLAMLDGNICGTALVKEEAQRLVDFKYKEKYG